MSAHDALAALLHDTMTDDAGNGCPGTCEGIAETLYAAGVRVTGDAGLREALDAVEANIAALDGWEVAGKAVAPLRRALTGDTPEAEA